MPDNPVIVFVTPSERNLPSAEKFPIGWRKMSDEVEYSATLSKKAFSVLFLDDSQAPVGDKGMPICFSDRPLLIVAHKSSDKNNGPDILNNPVLMSWGKPYICRWFSHGDKQTWPDIQSLVSGGLSAEEFIEKINVEYDLELYDRLAAICQINLLDPSSETAVAEAGTLTTLPKAFQQDWNAAKQDGGPDWFERLKITRTQAAILAR